MLRRASALGLLVLLALTGCSRGPKDPASSRPSQTTPAATAATPGLIVAAGSSVLRYAGGRSEKIGTLDEGTVGLAVEGADGSVIVQRDLGTPPGSRSELLALSDGKWTRLVTEAAPKVSLYDVVEIGGKEQVLYATFDENTKTETRGSLFRMPLSGTSRSVEIAAAFGPEYGTVRASSGGDVVVISAGCDLTECVSFYSPDGKALKRASPTDGLEYSAPPLITQAVLSPDGSKLAYLAGPDVDPTVDPERPIGGWTMHVTGRSGAAQSASVNFAGKNTKVAWFDYDGRWAVISTGSLEAPDRVFVIDTAEERPRARPVAELTGIATIAIT